MVEFERLLGMLLLLLLMLLLIVCSNCPAAIRQFQTVQFYEYSERV
jgi:hypothetical protein